MPDRDLEPDISEKKEDISWDRDAGFPLIPFDSQSFAKKPRSRFYSRFKP
jgi:hypothetical protein